MGQVRNEVYLLRKDSLNKSCKTALTLSILVDFSIQTNAIRMGVAIIYFRGVVGGGGGGGGGGGVIGWNFQIMYFLP